MLYVRAAAAAAAYYFGQSGGAPPRIGWEAQDSVHACELAHQVMILSDVRIVASAVVGGGGRCFAWLRQAGSWVSGSLDLIERAQHTHDGAAIRVGAPEPAMRCHMVVVAGTNACA